MFEIDPLFSCLRIPACSGGYFQRNDAVGMDASESPLVELNRSARGRHAVRLIRVRRNARVEMFILAKP